MKTHLIATCAVLALVLGFGPLHAEAAEGAELPVEPLLEQPLAELDLESADVNATPVPADQPVEFVSGYNYPPCRDFLGKPCPTPGAYVFCQYNPYEPECLTCGADHIWGF